MTPTPRDQSRDPRIEDPTNLYIVHPLANALLPRALSARISANAVSVAGLSVGTVAAACYYNWPSPVAALAGFALSVAWLVLDGLDGKIARATGTASATGRFLDGLCDHGVFVLIYLALAASLANAETWLLAVVAGTAHAIQSNLYETERARFHRRRSGDPGQARPERTGALLERVYDGLGGPLAAWAARFDRALAATGDRAALGARYADRAVAPMRALALLSANVRVGAILLACLLGDPALFFWLEIGPLTLVAAAGIVWHRRVEAAFVSSPRDAARASS